MNERDNDSMVIDYLSLLIFVAVAVGFALGTIVISRILGPHKPTYIKGLPYECGVDPKGEGQTQFEPKFYLVCLLFLLFDIEVVFLYLWALHAQDLKLFGFLEAIIFIFILLIGYLYGWQHKAFDWLKDKKKWQH